MDKAELRRAAIVLASLDLPAATAVCKHMSEIEAEMLISQIAALGAVGPEEQQAALAAFRAELDRRTSVDGAERAEQLMSSVLGRRHGHADDPGHQAVLQRLRGLSNLEAPTIRRMLEGESPQMAAVVLGQLSAQKAAQVVRLWPADQRGDLALRVARLGRLAPGTVEALGEALGAHAQRDDASDGPDQGITFLVSLLEDMDRAASRRLLEDLRGLDGELADQVEGRLFTFENIAQLPDESLQALLRAVDNAVMARALKGADQAIMQHVGANLSSRGKEMLDQEMELLGPVLVREVEEAQRAVVRKALELEEAGAIRLSTEEEVYVE